MAATTTPGRSPCIIGKTTLDLPVPVTDILYHHPSYVDSICITGPPGSGKSWVGNAIAQQWMLNDQTTILSFDRNASFIGLDTPNTRFSTILQTYGLTPTALDPSRIVVLKSPLTPYNTAITARYHVENYKIPISVVTVPYLLNLVGAAPDRGTLLANHILKTYLLPNPHLTVRDLVDFLLLVAANETLTRQRSMLCTYLDQLLSFQAQPSLLWSYLDRASSGTPYWIVIDTNEPMIVNAILADLYAYKKHKETINAPGTPIAVLMDHFTELLQFSSNKDAIYEFQHMKARRWQIPHIFMTQRTDLPAEYADRFTCSIAVKAYPRPGCGTYQNRLHTDHEIDPDTRLEFCPPLATVEGQIDDSTCNP